jgi:hypothetical protein
MKHVSTLPNYNEVRAIIDREKDGIVCTEDESATIKQWVKNTLLSPEDGSIDLDTEIQMYLPCEYGEAQTEIEAI